MKNIQVFSQAHRLTGIALIISGITHGILALGGFFSLHTGTLLWVSILVIFALYLVGKARLLKKWLLFHRIADMCFWGLLILHLTNPWLFILQETVFRISFYASVNISSMTSVLPNAFD
jgi:hypothetical protein